MSAKYVAVALALLVMCGCDSGTTTPEPVATDSSAATNPPAAPSDEANPSAKADPPSTQPDDASAKVDPPAAQPDDASQSAKTDPPATQGTSKKGMGKMMGSMKFPASKDMVFNDEAKTNVEAPKGLNGLVFVDTNNKRVRLQDYIGKKHVVLVFTEGFSGMLCPFCKTQTSRLVANYEKFAALNAEVLVVYPGERDHLKEFIEAAQNGDKEQVDAVPFPIVLDPKLSAVKHFDISSKLAHPSTYVIDKQGNVQLAYVGKDMSPDRPSIKALLETLERAEAGN